MATTPKKKNMTVTINVKTDKKTKEEAQRIAALLGISLSSVINISLRQFVCTGELHLRVVPREVELRWQKDIAEAKKNGKGYTDVKELMGDLMK